MPRAPKKDTKTFPGGTNKKKRKGLSLDPNGPARTLLREGLRKKPVKKKAKPKKKKTVYVDSNGREFSNVDAWEASNKRIAAAKKKAKKKKGKK